MNTNYYCSLLDKLYPSIREKRRGKLRKKITILQDNAPCHKVHRIMQTLGQLYYKVHYHPFYSPELAPSGYYLFPKLELNMKDRQFLNIDELISAVGSWFQGNQV